MFECILTIHINITLGWGAKSGLSVKNSLGFSDVSIHVSLFVATFPQTKVQCINRSLPLHSSCQGNGIHQFFPEIWQWDKQLQGNRCVDSYPAFKEYHLECDLYLKDTIINLYQVCLSVFPFPCCPSQNVSYMESNSVEMSQVSLNCSGHGFCSWLWELSQCG